MLGGDKTLVEVAGTDRASGTPVRGYEMHIGRTAGAGLRAADAAISAGAPDGAVSADGRVTGSYLHGLFAGDDFRHAFLTALRSARRDSDVALRDHGRRRRSTHWPIIWRAISTRRRILDLASRAAR